MSEIPQSQQPGGLVLPEEAQTASPKAIPENVLEKNHHEVDYLVELQRLAQKDKLEKENLKTQEEISKEAELEAKISELQIAIGSLVYRVDVANKILNDMLPENRIIALALIGDKLKQDQAKLNELKNHPLLSQKREGKPS